LFSYVKKPSLKKPEVHRNPYRGSLSPRRLLPHRGAGQRHALSSGLLHDCCSRPPRRHILSFLYSRSSPPFPSTGPTYLGMVAWISTTDSQTRCGSHKFSRLLQIINLQGQPCFPGRRRYIAWEQINLFVLDLSPSLLSVLNFGYTNCSRYVNFDLFFSLVYLKLW
jgi:hypothetical protein